MSPRHLLIVILSVPLYRRVTAIRIIRVQLFQQEAMPAWSVNWSAHVEKLTRITWQKRTRETHVNKDFFVITLDGKTEKINGLGDRAEFIGNIQEMNGTILLKEVLLLDEGIYTCIFNLFPSGPFEAGINLCVLAPPVDDVNTDVSPVVVVKVNSVTVTAGKDATLFCQLVKTNEKLTRITWQKRTRETFKNKDIFVITPDGKTENINGLGDRVEFIGNIQEMNGTILLKNVTLLDEGIYTCIFNIFPSGPVEAAIHLQILVPPVVDITTDVIPVVGESEVTLATCTAAKARPAAEVSWRLGDLTDSVKVKTIQSEDPGGTFTIKSFLIGVAFKDLNQQKVQCLVKHASLNEEVILDYALVIHYPPQAVFIKSVKAPAGTQEFQCVADANPQPTSFIWSRVNKRLSSHVDADRLTVPLTSDSNGLYICYVLNQYGNATGSLYVHAFPESTAVCWSLFGILLTVCLVFGVIWKLKLTGRIITFFSAQTERITRIPVPTSPPRDHQDRRGSGSL